MSTDFGVDVAALDDLPDPEVLVSGELNVGYALGRRLLQPSGALADIGETVAYDSIDVREWLGRRFDAREIADLQIQATQVLLQDARVLSVSVVVTFNAGMLNLVVQGQGTNGPFSFVLQTNGVTASILRGP